MLARSERIFVAEPRSAKTAENAIEKCEEHSPRQAQRQQNVWKWDRGEEGGNPPWNSSRARSRVSWNVQCACVPLSYFRFQVTTTTVTVASRTIFVYFGYFLFLLKMKLMVVFIANEIVPKWIGSSTEFIRWRTSAPNWRRATQSDEQFRKFQPMFIVRLTRANDCFF